MRTIPNTTGRASFFHFRGQCPLVLRLFSTAQGKCTVFTRTGVANAHSLSHLLDRGSEGTRLSGDLLDTTLEWLPVWDIDQQTGLKPSRFPLLEISRANLVRYCAMLGSSSVNRQMVGVTLFSADGPKLLNHQLAQAS